MWQTVGVHQTLVEWMNEHTQDLHNRSSAQSLHFTDFKKLSSPRGEPTLTEVPQPCRGWAGASARPPLAWRPSGLQLLHKLHLGQEGPWQEMSFHDIWKAQASTKTNLSDRTAERAKWPGTGFLCQTFHRRWPLSKEQSFWFSRTFSLWKNFPLILIRLCSLLSGS